MASPTSTDKFRSNYLLQHWDHDPGSTNAILASPDGGTTIRYVDMRDYEVFVASALSKTLTGAGITKLEIVASATTAFSAVTVIKDSGTVAADAEYDWVVQECTAQEIAQEGSDAGVELRYVAARITEANAADEALVTYIAFPKRPRLDLTPATTIS